MQSDRALGQGYWRQASSSRPQARVAVLVDDRPEKGCAVSYRASLGPRSTACCARPRFVIGSTVLVTVIEARSHGNPQCAILVDGCNIARHQYRYMTRFLHSAGPSTRLPPGASPIVDSASRQARLTKTCFDPTRASWAESGPSGISASGSRWIDPKTRRRKVTVSRRVRHAVPEPDFVGTDRTIPEALRSMTRRSAYRRVQLSHFVPLSRCMRQSTEGGRHIVLRNSGFGGQLDGFGLHLGKERCT